MFDVSAASITVLRRGQSAPPELIWSPTTRCAWRMRIAVGSGLYSTPGCTLSEGAPPIEWGPYQCGARRPVAGVTLCIEHYDRELVERFIETQPRGLRVMAWTTHDVRGHQRPAGSRWTRITVDELVHEFTCRRDQGSLSVLSSQVLSPIVDFTAPPTTP